MSAEESPNLGVRIDLTRERAGTTFDRNFTLFNADGSRFDPTGSTLTVILEFPTPVTLTVGDGITILDAPQGECNFEVSYEQSDWPEREYRYAVRVLKAGQLREPIWGMLPLMRRIAA